LTQALYPQIVDTLKTAGQTTLYPADANEPDPRYLGYGVRAPQMKQLLRQWQPAFRQLDVDTKIELATQLIESGYGEQKSVALQLLNQCVGYFTPEKFDLLDHLLRLQQGWSKIDAYSGSLLASILALHPLELITLIKQWNEDDELWLRRASVVVFTRKVAQTGKYTNTALQLCDNLKNDGEDMVQKGVGWCLKDLLKADRERILNYVIELRQQKVSSVITLYAIRDLQGAERERVLRAR
jgi:3-methyladenine DNA glycosylase AlkD